MTGAHAFAHYAKQAHRFDPHRLEGLRWLEQVEEVIHQRGEEALIAEHVSEEGRQVDFRADACDVIPRIVFSIEFMQAQRKRVHEYRLQFPQSQQYDRPQILRRPHGKQRLEMLDTHLQEIANIGIPEDVDIPAILIVHLRPVLHSDVFKHRYQHLHQQAVPLEVAVVEVSAWLKGHGRQFRGLVWEAFVYFVVGEEAVYEALQETLVVAVLEELLEA